MKYFAVMFQTAAGTIETDAIEAEDRSMAVDVVRELGACVGEPVGHVGVLARVFYRHADALHAAQDAEQTFRMALEAVR